jgi:hypothetical protein
MTVFSWGRNGILTKYPFQHPEYMEGVFDWHLRAI